MKLCPYCSYANQDLATQCRKCEASLLPQQGTLYKSYWVGPRKAPEVRSKALAAILIGLAMKLYWGGYGTWRVIDNPTLASVRRWLEPLLIIGGIVVYVVGWILNWI